MKKHLTQISILLVFALIFATFSGRYARYDAGSKTIQFGATSFPASLDSLTNPSATDSVATVSHSSQHSNANDAIEALEAKLGTQSSTAVTDSILAGNGSGSSIWTTFATTTRFIAQNFLSTASSTFPSFTAFNSTTTSATTTTSFSTTASSTNFYGAGLATCQTGNALTWTGGKFGCENTEAPAGTIFAATSTSFANLFVSGISVSQGDVIRAWASVDYDAAAGSMTLSYRYANSATTTWFTARSAGTNAAESWSLAGYLLATTTATLHVGLTTDIADTAGNGILMVQVD